jgi:O-antigen/teichoic acid export membrane protein
MKLNRTAARLQTIAGTAPRGARELLTNAGSLLGSVALTSLLGFPYWWLAARQFTPHAVGFAATAVSAMTLLGSFSMLGLGTLLTGELPRRVRDREAFVATAMALSGCAGFALGLGFGGAGAALLGLGGLAMGPGLTVLFAVGVGLTSVTMVADQALVGLLRGTLQLRRNLIFSLSKLVFLAAVVAAASKGGGMTIFETWLAGLALSTVWLTLHVARVSSRVRSYRPRWAIVREWRRPAFEHHLLNLALQAPTLAMPLLVTATISVTASAYYYAAALITGFMAYGAVALSYALYAVGVRDPANLPNAMRFTLRLSFAVILTGNVVLMVGANWILSVFGPGYSSHAATALRILGPIVFLFVIKDHYIAVNRVRGTVLTAAKLCVAGGVLELGCAAAGAVYGGLTWLALGMLAALMLESAIMAPTLVHELRRPSATVGGERRTRARRRVAGEV